MDGAGLSNAGANAINQVVYANSLFVGVGAGGTIITSSNGTTWTAQTSGTANALNVVAYNGSSLWVAAGASGTLLSSSNTTSWTSRTSNITGSIVALIYANSLWVAGGSTAGAALATSSNGTTWTGQSNIPASNSAVNSIIYANSLFVIGGASNTWAYSSSGTGSWTTFTPGGNCVVNGLIYADSIFVGVPSTASGFITSSSGTSWTLQSQLRHFHRDLLRQQHLRRGWAGWRHGDVDQWHRLDQHDAWDIGCARGRFLRRASMAGDRRRVGRRPDIDQPDDLANQASGVTYSAELHRLVTARSTG